uniref:Uncharacterized protein n=1 Tax=Anguilla anguilla TaxID=7936 RepID=A0A0E9PGY2_ANGAN
MPVNSQRFNGHGISREPQCEVMHCRFYLRECLHGDRAAWWILTLSEFWY